MSVWLDDEAKQRWARAVLSVWPEHRQPALTWLDEGFGSAVFATDDGRVAIVAKNAVGAESRGLTTAVTTQLAGRVPVEVPTPDFQIEASDDLPYGFYVCRRLPGRRLTFAEAATAPPGITSRLASFMTVMHLLSGEGAMPNEAFWRDIEDLRPVTDAVLRERLTQAEYAVVDRWWDSFLGDRALREAPACVVHGDLWPDNLLVDEKAETLLSIVDFGDTVVLDNAYDFAALRMSGPGFLGGCLDEYRSLGGSVDDRFEYRLQKWHEFRSGAWFGLRASIRAEDEGELVESLAKLRSSPILRGET